MGLECCNIAVQNGERAVPLEGEFDWLTAQVECIKLTGRTGEFVCFGGSDIKIEKLQTLKKAGVKILYLSFDSDTAGKKATRTAIKHAEEIGLATFTINLPYGQDPDSFIKSRGFSQYRDMIKNACSAPEWLAKEYLSKYHINTKEGLEKAKINLIEEAKNYKGLTLDSFLQATTRELNIDKNSILHLINNYRQEQTKGPETQSIKSNLPDAPAPDEFHIPQGWILNQAGLSKYTYTRDGLKEIIVAPAPFFVSSRSANIDTRNEKLEITYLRDKKWKTLYEERSILMDHRKIVQLSAKGFPVNSLNCKEIVNFIHSFEAINDEKFQKKATISGFGWKKEKGIPFFVMPDKAYGTDISIVFEPEGLGDERLAKALMQEGDFKSWQKAIRLCLIYPNAMFQVYAALTPPLLELLDAPNFIIDNWGLTSIGKTTVLEIAASVWGLPIKEQGGLIIGWDATKVFVERISCLFNHLPVFLDDSQTAKEKGKETTLYMVANGVGRQRGALKGTQKTTHWRTVTFSTGEQRLIDVTEFEGAKARTIELYGSPFKNEDQSELIHKIKSGIHYNYGHAGPLFVEELINRGYHISNQLLREEYRHNTLELSKLGKDNVSSRMAQYFAAVQIAGRIAEELFDFGADPKEIVKKLYLYTCGENKERGDYPQRALEYIVSWIQGNQNSFDKPDKEAEVERGEIYGVIREGEYIGIFPHKFKELFKKSEFDNSSVIKAFKEKKWLQLSPPHNTYPVGFRNSKVRMIKLIWSALSNLWVQ